MVSIFLERSIYMPIKTTPQPFVIEVDKALRLRTPDRSDWSKALPWYTNPTVLYYSEGVTDRVYDLTIIDRMYSYLIDIGELYFIEVYENQWKAIGDVTLSEVNMPIAIGDEKYFGRGIGKKVVSKLIERAKDIGMNRIFIPSIYVYNIRSQNLFKSLGFVEVSSTDKEKSFELVW
jgi:RimJ/RimL family protein N-acetyltransferase